MFAGSFNNLIKLNLSNCKIKNFEDLGILSSHDRLAELKLCNNPIETIKYSEGFVSLKKINVEGTLIEDLVTIFNFRSFPCLTEIRVGNTPISARLKNHFRKILVSYLSKATKINGGTVDAKERTLHERQFIRDFSDPKNSSEHVNSNEYLYKLVGFHLKPSEQEINSYVFRSLYSIQGAVYKFAEINLAPPTTAKLIFETEDGRKESKEVPLGWKVLNLKKLCQNLFGIPETQQKLFYLDSEVPALGMEILRFDNRALRTFKMKDNDVILVRVKD
jgi:Ubiquitin family